MDWSAFATWGFDTHGWARSTRDLYVRRCKAAQRWLDDHGVRLHQARHEHVRAWISSLPPTAASRNVARQALTGYFDWLISRRVRRHNPCDGIGSLAYPDTPPKALTSSQAVVVLACASTSVQWGAFMSVLMYVGLRCTEARTLTWQQIQGEWVRFTAKGNQERVLPLNFQARVALDRWRPLCPDPRWVFPSPVRDQPISETTVRDRVRAIGEAAGIVGLHPHLARHTLATSMLDAGASLRHVQEMLGHRSLQTTQRYLTVRPERLAEAVGTLPY